MSAPDRLEEQLLTWARTRCGAEARVSDVRPMPGNAGLSFAFTVERGAERERFVIRLAAAGVPERGPNDVLRQAPLLRALAAYGVPVAPVIWSSDDPAHFRSSALIVGFVEGRPLHVTSSELSAKTADRDARALVLDAVDELAAIHAMNWEARLPGWSTPVGLEEEAHRWSALLARVPAEEHAGPSEAVFETLLERMPAESRTGLLHGDFQTNNVLYANGQVVAVVDWELAGIGPQLLDLGWLILFNDPTCWDEGERARMRMTVAAGDIAARYAAAAGRDVDDLDWFRALACYRFAAITSYNLRLHRRGKRVDPEWERRAGSRQTLLARAQELLATGRDARR